MNPVVIVWTVISFIFFVLSVLVISPSRREVADALREVEALGQALDGTRVIAEAELSLRTYVKNAQMIGTIVMAVFLSIGVYSILAPPQTEHGEIRTMVIGFALIFAEFCDGILQGFLFFATLELRRSRQKWREIAEDPSIHNPYPEVEMEPEENDEAPTEEQEE